MSSFKSFSFKFVIDFLHKLAGNDKTIVSRVLKGASWIILGSVLSKILLLIASIIVARILGQSTYGELGILRSTINSFAMIASMGLGITATKFIAENLQKDKSNIGGIIAFTIRMSIIFSLVISFCIIIFSNSLSLIIEAPHLKFELIICAFVLFFIALNGALLGVLAGFEKFNLIAKGALYGAVFGLAFQILGAYVLGIRGVLFGLGTNYLIMFIYYRHHIYKLTKSLNIDIKFLGFRKFKDIFIKISLPAALGGLLVSPVFWLCNTIVVRQPNGFDEMAVLDASMQWQQIILFIPTTLSQLLLPILSSFSNDSESFKKSFNFNFIINISIALVIFLFIIFFSKNILQLYGKSFSEGTLMLILLCAATLPMICSGLIGKLLIAKDKVWVSFTFNLIWGVLILFLTYIFIIILNIGVIGYAYAFCISYIIHFLMNYSYYKLKFNDL
jgi:O-antigen/teichoic acid export membrane protein